MVILNTHYQQARRKIYQKLVFRYFLNFARSDCFFCSAKDERGRLKLFLAFNTPDRIYQRNGRKGTWDELESQQHYKELRARINEGLKDSRIPCFNSNSHNILN